MLTLTDSTDPTLSSSLEGAPLAAPDGIRQSFDNPMAAALYAPADEALRQWRRDTVDKLDADALDFDNVSPELDPWVRKRAMISTFLNVATDEDPGDGLAYEMLRDQVAEQAFEGRGKGSDDAFFAEFQKAAKGRKDGRSLDKTLTDAAALSATAQATDFFSRDLSTFAQWRDKARTSPGYDPKREADYLEAWEAQKEAVRDHIEPYLGPLSEVWSRMKSDEIGADVQKAYFQIPPDHRGDFMNSLAILAHGLPKEEQPKFWANVAKQTGRDVSGYASDVKTGTQKNVMQGGTVGMNELFSYGESDFGPLVKRQASDRAAYENFRRSSDFLADVRRVQQADYDPLKYIFKEGSVLQTGERMAYGAPGAALTSLSAAIPGVGMAAFYSASEESIYQDFRQSFQASGMSYEKARDRAEALAPIAAIPQVLAEKLQVEAVAGKLPAFESLIGGLADRLKNRALRFGARTVIGAVEEGTLEQAQDYIPPLVQDMANALGSDVPDVVWKNGKDGVLDGFWTDSAVMIGTMLPMAIFGAVGGVSKDARTKAFLQASDTELKAYGATDEAIAKLRAADGPYSLNAAVDELRGSLYPFSETAKAAVEQLKAEAEAAQQQAQAAERSGVMPRFVRDADGWTVYDGETQEEVGKAPDAAGAFRLAKVHSDAVDGMKGDRVAYLATMLEVGDTQSARDNGSRQTTTDFRPGEAVTTGQQAALSEADESRVAAQVAAKERLNGGDGSMAQLVLGQSSTETKQRVRQTVNRLNAGSSVLTVFHEEAHGFFREALATGRLTKDETIQSIRALETALAGKTTKDGQALRFLPENDADIDDTTLDEAVSELVEAEVLRNRKDGGKRQIPAGLISRNLTAIAKLAPGAAKKFSAFIAAVRAYFGLAFARAVAIRQGIKEGKIDKAKLDEFTNKLFGLNEQDAHDAAAAKEAGKILGETLEAGAAASLGPAEMADAIIGNATKRIKDPKQKAKVFTGIVERMNRLKRDASELAVFGHSYITPETINRELVRIETRREEVRDRFEEFLQDRAESELSQDDPIRETFESQMAELDQEQAAAIQDGRTKILEKLGPQDGQKPGWKKAYNEAVRQSDAKEKAKIDVKREKARRELEASIAKRSKADAADLARERRAMEQGIAELDAQEARISERAALSEQKTGILNALATLDGILMALPPELRGRVGGYTQLAKLGSDEARLKFLQGRVAKVETVVNEWLRGEYTKSLEKLLERAQPKREGGKKAKGKLGAEGHRYFAQVEAVTGMDEAGLELHLKSLDDRIAEADESELADLAEDYQIALTFGNFANKTPLEMNAALEKALDVYETGRNRRKTLEEARLADVKALAETGIEELGGSGIAARQAGKRRGKALPARVTEGRWGIYSLPEFLENLFGRDSQLAKRWGKAVRDGFRRRTSAIIQAERRWKAAMHEATGKTGRAARMQVYRMQTDFSVSATVRPQLREKLRVPIDTFFEAEQQKSLGLTKDEIAKLTEQFEALPEGSRKEYLEIERISEKTAEVAEFTEAEAIYLTMLWRQEGYKDGMTLHGLGADFQAELESGLSDAAKSLREYLAGEYAGNYEPLRQLFSRMFGVDLAQTDHYTPGKFYSQGSGQELDVTGSSFVEGGFKQGFLKDRKKHRAEAKAENAFQVYFAHLNQTEHWKALAEISREMHAVLGNPEMKKALQARDPVAAAALNDWLKAIDGNGLNQGKESWLLDALMKSQAYLAMAWKASTILKNGIGAAINSAYRMPTRDFLRGYGRLMAGKIDFSHVWNSDFIQNRIHGGFAPEARAAISDAFGAKPTLRGDFLLKGMEVIGTADSFGTACGAAVAYDYHLRQAKRAGLSDRDAEAAAMNEAAEVVSRTAQPAEVTDRSLMELKIHGIGRLAFVFASEARQKSAMWLTALVNTLTGKATIDDVRVLVISHFVMAPIMQAIGAMVRDARNDDDDEWFDDKYWNVKDFAIAMATGPLSGLPLVRDVVDGYSGDSGPLKRMFDSGKAAKKLFADEPKGNKADWYEAQITKLLQGFNPSLAVGSSVFDQIYDVADNLGGKD